MAAAGSGLGVGMSDPAGQEAFRGRGVNEDPVFFIVDKKAAYF